jgi:protein-tyrosine phosphatase
VAPTPPAFVDIHCHLLAGLDDGADDWDESLAMARLAVSEGIRTVIVTPHQLGNYAHNRGETIRVQTARFQEFLDDEGVDLTVLPGADVRIEPDLVSKIRSGDVVTLADQRRYLLLELPHEVYLPLDRLLAELSAAGLAGILSHPERNQGILRQPGVVARLVDAGCLMQITAGSLAGTFGPQVQALTEHLVAQGLVHFVATDAHGVKARRPLMRRAFQRLTELVGEQTAGLWCAVNPACVAQGRPVARGRRRPAAAKAGGWFRWGKAG